MLFFLSDESHHLQNLPFLSVFLVCKGKVNMTFIMLSPLGGWKLHWQSVGIKTEDWLYFCALLRFLVPIFTQVVSYFWNAQLHVPSSRAFGSWAIFSLPKVWAFDLICLCLLSVCKIPSFALDTEVWTARFVGKERCLVRLLFCSYVYNTIIWLPKRMKQIFLLVCFH